MKKQTKARKGKYWFYKLPYSVQKEIRKEMNREGKDKGFFIFCQKQKERDVRNYLIGLFPFIFSIKGEDYWISICKKYENVK